MGSLSWSFLMICTITDVVNPSVVLKCTMNVANTDLLCENYEFELSWAALEIKAVLNLGTFMIWKGWLHYKFGDIYSLRTLTRVYYAKLVFKCFVLRFPYKAMPCLLASFLSFRANIMLMCDYELLWRSIVCSVFQRLTRIPFSCLLACIMFYQSWKWVMTWRELCLWPYLNYWWYANNIYS